MKIFNNISIIDSVDSCCSVKGNELIYEKEDKTNILIPCFNVGFYENEINQSSITKAIDICYFLFEDVSKFEIGISTYGNLFPSSKGLIDFDGNNFRYSFIFGRQEGVKEYEIGGVCLRINSFSYGNYKVFAKSMRVILLEETKFLNEYTSNDSYKTDASLQAFLLNQDIKYIDKIIKAI
jgi:hypothetical protein